MNGLVIDALFLAFYLCISSHLISKKSGNLDFLRVAIYLFVCGIAAFVGVVIIGVIWSFIVSPF